MKIAVASDDGKTISHHFGRAAGFVVVDIDDGRAQGRDFRKNHGHSDGRCGSCDHARMIDNIKDCETVISHGMGQRIFEDLRQNGIKAIVTDADSVEDALRMFLDGSISNRTDRLH
jgi:predicted Fe-Mo cluster-binding NifX family protein